MPKKLKNIWTWYSQAFHRFFEGFRLGFNGEFFILCESDVEHSKTKSIEMLTREHQVDFDNPLKITQVNRSPHQNQVNTNPWSRTKPFSARTQSKVNFDPQHKNQANFDPHTQTTSITIPHTETHSVLTPTPKSRQFPTPLQNQVNFDAATR